MSSPDSHATAWRVHWLPAHTTRRGGEEARRRAATGTRRCQHAPLWLAADALLVTGRQARVRVRVVVVVVVVGGGGGSSGGWWVVGGGYGLVHTLAVRLPLGHVVRPAKRHPIIHERGSIRFRCAHLHVRPMGVRRTCRWVDEINKTTRLSVYVPGSFLALAPRDRQAPRCGGHESSWPTCPVRHSKAERQKGRQAERQKDRKAERQKKGTKREPTGAAELPSC